MNTAPITADFDQTVNAVVIGSSVWLERPALIVNKIKALVMVKINENSSLQESGFLACSSHRRASNPTNKTNMKTEKFCTVTQTNNMKSFGLYFCKAQKKDGAWVVTKILDIIETGSNPSSLAAAGEKLGLIVVNPPTAKMVYIMRGTRQDDGEIIDPLVDWNGNVIEQCPRSRGTAARALEISEAK